MSGKSEGGESVLQVFTDPEQWRHRPIMVKRSVDMISARASPEEKWSAIQPIDLHTSPPEMSAIAIDNDHFVGTAYILIRGISSTPPGMFGNQARKMQSIVQGRFKRVVPFSSVLTGQALTGPLVNVPARWLMPAVLAVLSKFQPDLKLSVDGKHPYALSSLIATSQSVSISLPGNEPNIFSLSVPENLNLLGPRFIGLSQSARKSFFSNPKNLAIYQFEPDFVYTFDFYQHVVDFSTFAIDAAVFQIDILKVLGARPIQIMACIWNSSTAVSEKDEEEEEEPTVPAALPGTHVHSPAHTCGDVSRRDYPTVELVMPPSPPGIGTSTSSQTLSLDDCPWTYLYNFEVWHEKALPPRSYLEREYRKCFEGVASSAVEEAGGNR